MNTLAQKHPDYPLTSATPEALYRPAAALLRNVREAVPVFRFALGTRPKRGHQINSIDGTLFLFEGKMLKCEESEKDLRMLAPNGMHYLPQHILYFFPLPHGQGSFLPTFFLEIS